MVKHTLKILRCETKVNHTKVTIIHNAKFLKYVWLFFSIMHKRVK